MFLDIIRDIIRDIIYNSKAKLIKCQYNIIRNAISYTDSNLCLLCRYNQIYITKKTKNYKNIIIIKAYIK